MKRILALSLLFTAGLALAATTKRDSVVEVTATETATATTLAGTQTVWNLVTIHNHGSVRVGICLVSNDDTCAAMTNYTTRKLEIPAGATLEIRKENVTQIKHATESATAALVIERAKETH